MVSEGDTVTVGQDVAKLETGEGGGGGKQEATTPAKEPPSSEQPAASDPEPKKEAPAPPKEEKKAPPPPPPSEDKPTSKKDEKKPEASPSGAGGRGETRVCLLPTRWKRNHSLIHAGENEPHATEDRRASQAVTKHSCISHNIQRGRHVQHNRIQEVV